MHGSRGSGFACSGLGITETQSRSGRIGFGNAVLTNPLNLYNAAVDQTALTKLESGGAAVNATEVIKSQAKSAGVTGSLLDQAADLSVLRGLLQQLTDAQLQTEFQVREQYRPTEGGRSWAGNRPVWLEEFTRRGLTPGAASWWSKIPTWAKVAMPVGAGLVLFGLMRMRRG